MGSDDDFVLNDPIRMAQEMEQDRAALTAATQTDIFSAVVPQGVIRYVIDVLVTTDGTARQVKVERKDRDTTSYTTILNALNCPASSNTSLKSQLNMDSNIPVIRLFEGENLTLTSPTGSTVDATAWYIDSHPRQ